MWVVKKLTVDEHFSQILLKNCCFECLTSILLLFRFAANKEELPGTIMSNKAEMVPDIQLIYNFE